MPAYDKPISRRPFQMIPEHPGPITDAGRGRGQEGAFCVFPFFCVSPFQTTPVANACPAGTRRAGPKPFPRRLSRSQIVQWFIGIVQHEEILTSFYL
jgi:hypothetical protein